MNECFIAGILIGVGIGCIGCLLINESWFKRMNELNSNWSDFAEQQSRDWASFANNLGNAIANDILREAKNASSDVHDGGSGSEAASDSVSA